MSVTRTLTAAQQQTARNLKESGWSVDALSRLYGVSRRTIYRYLEGDLFDVHVADYVTTFYVGPNKTPRRAAPWRKL